MNSQRPQQSPGYTPRQQNNPELQYNLIIDSSTDSFIASHIAKVPPYLEIWTRRQISPNFFLNAVLGWSRSWARDQDVIKIFHRRESKEGNVCNGQICAQCPPNFRIEVMFPNDQ
eukprot:g69828.t1